MDYWVDIVRLAWEFGAKIEEYPLELLDWLVTRIWSRTFVVLRSSACMRTKRFTIAHELAHLEDETVTSTFSLIAERRADKIACEKLIPETALRRAVEDYGADYHVLSTLFWVPERSMKRRIQEVFNL